MKKITLVALALLSFSLYTQAQYKLSVSNGTYTALDNATELTFNTSAGGYLHKFNFTFPVFHRQVIFSSSNPAYMNPRGYLAVDEPPGIKSIVTFQGLYHNSKFGKVDGVTRIFAKIEGAAPDRVAKFEWRGQVYDGDTNQKADYQVWLHEKNGNVSYHYGSNTIAGAASLPFYIGIIVFNPSFSALVDQFSLKGSVAAPQIEANGSSLNLPTVTGIPANGSVYTFERFYTGIDDLPVEPSKDLYPNPATGNLTINYHEPGNNRKIAIISMTGQQLFVTDIDKDAHIINISIDGLPDGMYLVQKITDGQIKTERFIKGR